MTEIRYWEASNTDRNKQSTDARRTRAAVDRYDQSFQASLLGELSGKGGDALSLGSGLGGAMGGKGPKLMDLDIPGIEKVWAAQLSSPESYFDFGGNADKSDDGTGLGGMLNLMIQEQTLRARENIARDSYSFDEFVNDIGVDRSTIETGLAGMDNQDYASLDAFVSSMQRQIELASDRFGIGEQELSRRLTAGYQDEDEKTGRGRIRTW